MNDKNATIINEIDIYPDGANYPTYRTEYLCPCGKGKIVYERVAGFNDNYAFIECDECKKHYDIVTGQGYLWELRKK